MVNFGKKKYITNLTEGYLKKKKQPNAVIPVLVFLLDRPDQEKFQVKTANLLFPI